MASMLEQMLAQRIALAQRGGLAGNGGLQAAGDTFDSSGPASPAVVPGPANQAPPTDPGQAAPQTSAAPAQNPTAELANAYQMYLHKRGLQKDPLIAIGGRVLKQGAGADSSLGAIANIAFRNQQAGNARQGQIGQAINIGSSVYHVYYDPKTGKRTAELVSGKPLDMGRYMRRRFRGAGMFDSTA